MDSKRHIYNGFKDAYSEAGPQQRRVVGYASVPRTDQADELSLTAQRRAIRDYCDRCGYVLHRTYEDDDYGPGS